MTQVRFLTDVTTWRQHAAQNPEVFDSLFFSSSSQEIGPNRQSSCHRPSVYQPALPRTNTRSTPASERTGGEVSKVGGDSRPGCARIPVWY